MWQKDGLDLGHACRGHCRPEITVSSAERPRILNDDIEPPMNSREFFAHAFPKLRILLISSLQICVYLGAVVKVKSNGSVHLFQRQDRKAIPLDTLRGQSL